MIIRKETEKDCKGIHALVKTAFETAQVSDGDGIPDQFCMAMDAVWRKFLGQGCAAEETARRAQCPVSFAENCMEEK